MDAAKSVTAVFRQRYELTTSPSTGGSVTVSPVQPDYASGQTVTLQAVPAEGYRFAGWSGDLSGLTNPATVAMNGDKSVAASFVRQFTLELTFGGGWQCYRQSIPGAV